MNTYTGIVQKGSRRGAALGFPTANIVLNDVSLSGIYAAQVKVGEEVYEAAAYADTKKNIIEAHLLDFSGDLYGRHISIELLKKIRDDRQFPNEEALCAAISDDVAKVREYFKN